jgi:hypothetical protein
LERRRFLAPFGQGKWLDAMSTYTVCAVQDRQEIAILLHAMSQDSRPRSRGIGHFPFPGPGRSDFDLANPGG